MKMLFLILSFCLVNSLYARDDGLFHLAPFQDNKNAYKLAYFWQENELSFKQAEGREDQIEETYHELNFEYSRKIFARSIGTVGLSFTHARIPDIRYVMESSDYYEQSGFSEPYFKWSFRKNYPTAQENFIDLYVVFQPSLFEKKVGTDAANNFIGQHKVSLGLINGKEEEFVDWEFLTRFSLTYYFNGKEQDMETDQERELVGYTDIIGEFSSLYFINESWFIKAGVILTVYGNRYAKMNGDSSTIQRGTALTKEIGVSHQRNEYIYSLIFDNTNNDYFLGRETGNLEGDYRKNRLSLSLQTSY